MKLLDRVKKALEQSPVGSSVMSLAERSLLSLVPVAADVYRRLRNWSDNHLGDVPGELRWPSAPPPARDVAPTHDSRTVAAPVAVTFHPARQEEPSPSRRSRKPRASRRRARKLPGRTRRVRLVRRAAGQSVTRAPRRRRR